MNKFVSENDSKIDFSQHPRTKANIFEILTFSWMLNLFKLGHKRDLYENDLYTTLNEHSSASLGNELEKKWSEEMTFASDDNRKPSLIRVLIKMFGYKYLFCGLIIIFTEIILKVSQPLLIGEILIYFDPESSKKISTNDAYMYGFGLSLNLFASMSLRYFAQNEALNCGMKMRVACCSVIYRKALRLSHTALGEITVGKVINLLSNDVNRFDFALRFLHFLWVTPLQTILFSYFLWREIGVSSLFGVAIWLLSTALQGWVGKKMSKLRSKVATRTDKRVSLMREIIAGIQVIKMYTWEKPFAKLIEHARKMEMQQIRGSIYFKAISSTFVIIQPKFQIFVSVLAYVLLGNVISVKKVFIVISYYNLLIPVFFNQIMTILPELLVSIKRIQHFLLCDEKNDKMLKSTKTVELGTNGVELQICNNEKSTAENRSIKRMSNDFNNVSLIISNATAKWTKNLTVDSLRNIDLTVKRNQLVAIIGPVGAGKSSLLHAILRELPLIEGSVSVHGVISYASQEPWLFSGSVKQNILFNSPMDHKRYKQVVQVCALKNDFEQFPYGDRTIVGERGATISGGQRARINLARAIYKQADVYLLDDPLSAVDARVGKHLFEKCIKGYLKEKTCILVTHQIQFLNDVDRIFFMDKASILAEGSYQELQASGFDFTRLLKSSEETKIEPDSDDLQKNVESQELCSNSSDRCSIKSSSTSLDESEFNGTLSEPKQNMEVRSFGQISKSVYLAYFSAAGSICKIVCLIFMYLLSTTLSTLGDYWISYWVNQEEYVFRNENSTAMNNYTLMSYELSFIIPNSLNVHQIYMSIYAIIIILMIASLLIRASTIVSFFIAVSMNLHRKMFNTVIRATMYFFNTNSSGIIFNRFSKDIGFIDEVLPSTIMETFQTFSKIMSVVLVIGLVNSFLLIPTFIIAIIFYRLRGFYLPTSRSLKRLEGVTRSPVLGHFNSTMQGLTTIRASNAEQVLSKEFDEYQDKHSSVHYLYISSSGAFGVWLDAVCWAYISVIVFSFIIFNNNEYGGYVGLVITQAFGLAGMVQYGIILASEVENQMTAVERILEYTKCPQEAALQSSSNKIPPKGWPDFGKIVFKNFNLRYSPDEPLVLNNLNIVIQPMEKIGVVGRTGAGKSSLIEALFRLAQNEGSIVIDDVEIHELELQQLRSSFSIIPQQPVLFSGTLRNNLDPSDEYPDHILWDALNEVELKVSIENLPDGLNTNISESGSNFSVGQKQLICLARAIVRHNKILILDEATANVDPQTDTLIQNTIRSKFRLCTVITIAHRLDTIMDSDKVLVMDAGVVVEYDHPHNLLKNKLGHFHQMVEQTGQVSADLLHNVASNNFKSKRESPITFICDDLDGA